MNKIACSDAVRLANGAEGIGNGSARDIDDGSDVGLSELLIAAWMEAFSEGRTSSSRPGVDRRAGSFRRRAPAPAGTLDLSDQDDGLSRQRRLVDLPDDEVSHIARSGPTPPSARRPTKPIWPNTFGARRSTSGGSLVVRSCLMSGPGSPSQASLRPPAAGFRSRGSASDCRRDERARSSFGLGPDRWCARTGRSGASGRRTPSRRPSGPGSGRGWPYAVAASGRGRAADRSSQNYQHRQIAGRTAQICGSSRCPIGR